MNVNLRWNFFFSAQMPRCMHDVNSSHLNWKEKNMRRVCNTTSMSMWRWRRCGMWCGDARFAKQWASTNIWMHVCSNVSVSVSVSVYVFFFFCFRCAVFRCDDTRLFRWWRCGERVDACLHIMRPNAVTYLMEVDDIIWLSVSISIQYQTWSHRNIFFPFVFFIRARALLKLFVCVHVCLVERGASAFVRACVCVCLCLKPIKLQTRGEKATQKKKKKNWRRRQRTREFQWLIWHI